MRQGAFYLAGGFDKINGVVVVLLDTRGDGEDVGVEDDVTGFEPNLVDQKVVGPSADLVLTLCVCGLEGRRAFTIPRPIIAT